MRITKYGHSCLFVEEGAARILIDPGCNVLLLTHEHPDHTDPEAPKVILQKSAPVILTNMGVQKVLRENGIVGEVLARGEEREVQGTKIRAVACDHGHIADHFPAVENVGFLIGGRLFHPGDCVAPSEAVRAEILAAPVVAPWMAVREGLEFVKKVKPKYAIPIHDAMVKWPEMPWYKIFETGLEGSGIEFIKMTLGKAKEF